MTTDDTIIEVRTREVLDSRGQPTVEVDVFCMGGGWGRAIVPSGASTGRHEAVELRDGDASRFAGKGVRKAVAHVRETIRPVLMGKNAGQQALIDHLLISLDGTPNKSRLGANAILGVSLACAHAAAASCQQPLWQYLAGGQPVLMPMPMVNLISGGLHAGKNIEFQDFLFLPLAARSYSEALALTAEVYRTLGDILKKQGLEGVLVGDEGGFGPKLKNNQEALDLIVAAFNRLGLKPGQDAGIALDVASTHFFKDGLYHLQGQKLEPQALAQLLAGWVRDYPILSIEDGMAEDDWDGWKALTQELGHKIQLIGDDLFVTNVERVQKGIAEKVANCVLVKVNQIGTLSETLDVLELAYGANYKAVISARSGETEDATIADFAVASCAGQIKIGSIARGERLAKYNQLLRIEEQLGPNAPFANPFG